MDRSKIIKVIEAATKLTWNPNSDFNWTSFVGWEATQSEINFITNFCDKNYLCYRFRTYNQANGVNLVSIEIKL